MAAHSSPKTMNFADPDTLGSESQRSNAKVGGQLSLLKPNSDSSATASYTEISRKRTKITRSGTSENRPAVLAELTGERLKQFSGSMVIAGTMMTHWLEESFQDGPFHNVGAVKSSSRIARELKPGSKSAGTEEKKESSD